MTKFTRILFLAPMLCVHAPLAKAVDINIAASALENGLGLSDGTDLIAGNLLRIGYFAVNPGGGDFAQLPDATLIANRYDYAFLNAHFVPFAGDFFSGDIAGAPDPDYASSQFFAYLTGSPGNFVGKNIYLWAFNTSSAPVGTLPSGAEMGIFKSNSTFPSGADEFSTEGAINLSLAEVPLGNIVLGGFGVGTVDPAGVSPGGAPLYNLGSLTPTIRFQSATFSTLENAGTATITVVRDGNPAGAVSAQIASGGGTATPGADYTAVNHTVEFADGETSKSVIVTLIDDNVFEAPGFETVGFTLTAPTGGAVLGAQATATLTIEDDDENPVGQFNFSSATYQGSENAAGGANTIVTITVTRTGGAAGAVAVDVVATGGTATSGADFTLPGTPVTLSWDDEETGAKTFNITIVADSEDEGGSETITLALQNATNDASIGAVGSATVTILDSDSTAPTVTLLTPKENAKVTAANVNFTGRAEDNSGVARVEVALNGAAPQIVTPAAPGTTFDWSLLTIPEQGQNTVTVTAFDLQGNASPSVNRTFTFVNLRPALAGNYNGLITLGPDSTTPFDHQGLIALKVTPTGSFSGKVTLSGATLPVSGVFGTNGEAKFGKLGTAKLELIKKAKPANVPLGHLSLTLDTAGGDVVTGALTDAAGTDLLAAVPSADRALYTAKKNPVAPLMNVPTSLLDLTQEKGKYTAIFQADDNGGLSPDTFPQGNGHGMVTIAKTGTVKIVGRLADGSKVSYSNTLSKQNEWPLFIALYKKTGFVTGQVAFDPTETETDAAAPNMRWFKPANAKDKLYPAGWPAGIDVDFAASKYVVPTSPNTVLGPTVPGAASPSVANIEIIASAGALPADTSNDASLSAKSVVTVIGPTPGQTGLEGVKMKFSKTGAMKGTFVHPGTGKSLKFEGVAFQKTATAAGFFLFVPPKSQAGVPAESGAVGVEVKN